MKKLLNIVKNNKRMLICLSILLIAGVVILCSLDKDLKIENELAIYMQYGDSEYLVFCTNSNEYRTPKVKKTNKKTEGSLYIVNGMETITAMTITVEKDAVTVYEGDIEFNKNNEEACIIDLSEFGEGEYDVSFVINDNENYTHYVSTYKMFKAGIENENITDKNLCMLKDINVLEDSDTLIIRYPFVWKTCGRTFTSKGNLLFKSENTGRMVIDNTSVEDIQTAGVISETPLWEYDIKELFGEFKEENFCYINAESVNDRKIDISTLYISSEKALEKYVVDGKLKMPSKTKEIVISGDVKIDNLIVNSDISVRIAGNVEVKGQLLFSTKEKGKISIDTSDNNIALTEKIFFEAPLCEVVWKGDDIPSTDHIQKYMNVEVYNENDMDLYIGGIGGTRLVSGKLCTKDKREFDFRIDGNYLITQIGYNDSLNLEDVSLDLKLDGDGTSCIEKYEDTYYCIIVDNENNKRGYKLDVEYKEYNLPVIYISTENGASITSQKEYIGGQFSIDYNGIYKYENITEETINIRGRGNSSWKLQKKPYKIKFSSKTSLFGLEKAKEWVLQANHIDRSLIRNTMAMNMASVLDNMSFIPHSYLVDVFVNGKYQGVYSLTEQIEVKDGRIEGEKDSTDVDTDYLIELGGEEEKTVFGTNIFHSELYSWIEIKNPDSDVLSYEQYQYINQYMNKVDESVINLDNYEEYLDVDSLIDWFILNEFSYNVDGTFRRSDFMLKKKGGKLYMAAPWDYDYAFGNFSLDSSDFSEWICLGNSQTDAYKGKYIKTNWMDYLLKDEKFCKRLKKRWAEVGKKAYDKAMETIDYATQNAAMSADENFSKWSKCLGVKLQYESKKTLALKTYMEQLEYLRSYIENRYNWMDKTINKM